MSLEIAGHIDARITTYASCERCHLEIEEDRSRFDSIRYAQLRLAYTMHYKGWRSLHGTLLCPECAEKAEGETT